MPHLARSFQQIVDIRTGECEQDHYIDFGRLTTSCLNASTPPSTKQNVFPFPESWCPLGQPVQFFESTLGDTCRTHRSRHCYPNSLGTIHRFQNEVDGSSQEARPVRLCHREVCLERREIKQSLLGVMEEHSSQVIVYRKNLQTSTCSWWWWGHRRKELEKWSDVHVADIMMDSGTNPTNDLAAIVGECRVCRKPTSDYTTGGVQTPYETSFEALQLPPPSTWSAIHWRCDRHPVRDQVYRDVDLIVPSRHDHRWSRFHTKMGLRILPIALRDGGMR
jgi:hypothetical protein